MIKFSLLLKNATFNKGQDQVPHQYACGNNDLFAFTSYRLCKRLVTSTTTSSTLVDFI